MRQHEADRLLSAAAADTGSDIPEEVAAMAMRALADAIGRRAMAQTPTFTPRPEAAMGTMVVEFEPDADWDDAIRFMETALDAVVTISPKIVSRVAGGDILGVCRVNHNEE